MQSDERGFLLRFSVRAEIPSALLDDDDFDERAFLDEWSAGSSPRWCARSSRCSAAPGWEAHVRNRGALDRRRNRDRGRARYHEES